MDAGQSLPETPTGPHNIATDVSTALGTDGDESELVTPTARINTGENTLSRSPHRSDDSDSEYSGYGRSSMFTENDDAISQTLSDDGSNLGPPVEGDADSLHHDLMSSEDIFATCDELRATRIPPHPAFVDWERLLRICRSARRINQQQRTRAETHQAALDGTQTHCMEPLCRQNVSAFVEFVQSGPFTTTDRVLETIGEHMSTWETAANDLHAGQRDGRRESGWDINDWSEMSKLTKKVEERDRTIRGLRAELSGTKMKLEMARKAARRLSRGQRQMQVEERQETSLAPGDDGKSRQDGSSHQRDTDEPGSLCSPEPNESTGDVPHVSRTRDERSPGSSNGSSSTGSRSPAGSSPDLGGLAESFHTADGPSDGNDEVLVDWREKAQEQQHRAEQQEQLLEDRAKELKDAKRELEECKRELEDCKRESQELEDRMRERPSSVATARRRSSQFFGMNFGTLFSELRGNDTIPDSPRGTAFEIGPGDNRNESRLAPESPSVETTDQHQETSSFAQTERRQSLRRQSRLVGEEQLSLRPRSLFFRDLHRAPSPVREEQPGLTIPPPALATDEQLETQDDGFYSAKELRRGPRSLKFLISEQLRAWLEVWLFLHALALYPMPWLAHCLSNLSFLAHIDWDCWLPAPVPLKPVPTQAFGHVLRQAVIFLSMQTYISCHHQRRIWLDANTLTRTYLVQQFREGGRLWWFPGVDPDLMTWGRTFSPSFILLAQTADMWAPFAVARLRKMKLTE